MNSLVRIVLAAIIGCLAAGLVHELFAAGGSGRGLSLQSIVEMAWLSAKWAFPFALVGIILGEVLRLRSGLIYLLGGLLIALGAGLLYRDGNVPEIASLFRVPNFATLMSMGTIGGLVYWLLQGHRAGWLGDAAERKLAESRGAVLNAFAQERKPRCWPCLLAGGLLAALPLLALGLLGVSRPNLADTIRLKTEGEAKAALTQAGYPWASLRVDGYRGHIIGTAPDEASKEKAFAVAQSYLEPAIGMPGVIGTLENDILVPAPVGTPARPTLAAAQPAPPTVATAEAKRKADADAEAKRVAEAEAKRKADAEAEARRVAEAEAKRKADADTEAKRVAEADAKRKADADAEAKRVAEADAKRKADADAEAKRVAEADAKRKADADAEAKRKADAEAEAKRLADAETKRKADEAARTTVISRTPASPPATAGAPAVSAAPATIPAAPGYCDADTIAAIERARIPFDTASSSIGEPDRVAIARLADGLKRCASMKLTINGHADSIGGLGYNSWLAQQRAELIRNELSTSGIAAERMIVRSFGNTRPIVTNATLEGRALNRRVDFSLDGRMDVTQPTNAARLTTCRSELAKVLAAGGLAFEPSSAVIKSESKARLDELASTALGCSAFGLLVEGHADKTGNPIWNVQLSGLRAQAVRDALIARGVPAGRIDAKGFGASRLIDPADTPEAHARNRRIEVSVAPPTFAN